MRRRGAKGYAATPGRREPDEPDDGGITMTDGDGDSGASRERRAVYAPPDDNARAIAGRMTREIRSAGELDRAGFYRVLEYHKLGIV